MTLATEGRPDSAAFLFEDISTGVYASGFGQVGDGRSFSFHLERQYLVVEVYRPRLRTPVPTEDDLVARSVRKLTDIDMTDERSLAAAVRDAVSCAQSVVRPGR